MNIFDLIVIGAGPAGSSAAAAAARSGMNVLIIDKSDFPRDKPCGGGLSAAAVKEIDGGLPEELIEQTCRGMRSLYKGREHITRLDSPVAYMVDRSRFDSYLLDNAKKAGALFNRSECLKVRETSALVEVETDRGLLYARYAVGADGYFSPTAKAVRLPFSDKEIRFCLVSRPETVDHPVFEGPDSLVELDFGFIRKGYGWLFPKKGYISAGIGGEIKNGRELKELYEAFLESHNLPAGGKAKGCFIPVSDLTHRISTGRIMLAGDAAGLVDSFSGEGIKNAIISGRIAGETAAEALISDRTVKEYSKRIYRVLRSDLKWSEKVSRMSYRFENIVFGHLLTEDRVMNLYFDVLRGRRSYRSFFISASLALPFTIFRKKLFRHFS